MIRNKLVMHTLYEHTLTMILHESVVITEQHYRRERMVTTLMLIQSAQTISQASVNNASFIVT